MEKKIKDIYKCKSIPYSNEVYNLEVWYNQLIEKKFCEITLKDVLIMFRQDLFTEIAFKKAIVILKNNPLAGEMYEGELLEKLLDEKNEKLTFKYKNDIQTILEKGKNASEDYIWINQDEKNEYLSIIENYELNFK